MGIYACTSLQRQPSQQASITSSAVRDSFPPSTLHPSTSPPQHVRLHTYATLGSTPLPSGMHLASPIIPPLLFLSTYTSFTLTRHPCTEVVSHPPNILFAAVHPRACRCSGIYRLGSHLLAACSLNCAPAYMDLIHWADTFRWRRDWLWRQGIAACICRHRHPAHRQWISSIGSTPLGGAEIGYGVKA